MEKSKRKQCSTEGCRKFVALNSNSSYCPKCLELQKLEDFADAVMKLDELEANRWGRIDAEIRNAIQGQRIKDLEMRVSELEELLRRQKVEAEEQKLREVYERKRTDRTIMKQKLVSEVSNLRKEYEELTESIAKKYKIDKNKMSIDPNTGTIRELDF